MKKPSREEDAVECKVPFRRFYGESMNSLMGSIESMAATMESIARSDGWTGRTVMGYKLPVWQREEVWTDEQCEKFIESVYLGANLGSFMVNMSFGSKDCDGILLDGQQRLRAVEKYLSGDLSVEGEDGVRRKWTELPEDDKSRFRRIPFSWLRTNYDDENTLKEAYDRHNFSGTPHSPDQKAGGTGFRSSKRVLPK